MEVKESIGIKEGCPGLTAALALRMHIEVQKLAREKFDSKSYTIFTSRVHYANILGNAKS